MKLAGVFLMSLVPRAIYLLWMPPAFDGYYWDLAASLASRGTLELEGVRTTRFEPLYPLFLAAGRLVTGNRAIAVQLLQCGVASLGAVFLFLAAESLANRRVAIVTSVLFAFHPLLIRHASDLSDSAMTTTLLLLFVWMFLRGGSAGMAAAAGMCLGLAALTRSIVVPLFVLAPALLWARRGRVAALACVGAACVTIAPMLLYDYAASGVLAPARSGVNLFIGNSPYTASLLPAHSPDILQNYADQVASAALGDAHPDSPGFADRSDAVLGSLAWARMKASPLSTLVLKTRNVGYFFSPFLVPSHMLLPSTSFWIGEDGEVHVENAPLRPFAERAIYTSVSLVILPLAAAGVVLRRRTIGGDAILWCVLATFAAVYALYFPATRYEAPVEFVLLFYAAAGVVWIAETP